MAPTAEEAPAAIHERISRAVKDGFHILTFAELRFEGDMPRMSQAEAAHEHPTATHVITTLIEHDNHWHLYVITLAKPELDTHSHDLTDRVLTMLAGAVMDEQANVAAVGRA